VVSKPGASRNNLVEPSWCPGHKMRKPADWDELTAAFSTCKGKCQKVSSVDAIAKAIHAPCTVPDGQQCEECNGRGCTITGLGVCTPVCSAKLTAPSTTLECTWGTLTPAFSSVKCTHDAYAQLLAAKIRNAAATCEGAGNDVATLKKCAAWFEQSKSI
jgi:hypothetical protein